MKRSAPPQGQDRMKTLAALRSVRVPAAADVAQALAPVPVAGGPQAAAPASTPEFREAMRGVKPLVTTPVARGAKPLATVQPQALQRTRDDLAALDESLSEEIDVETLLDTDDSLSFRRNGISADTLRKLRRGFWVVQAELDLHGHRVEEARYALREFLRMAMLRGHRCVRIVHGKGLGSRAGIPILKGKVRVWLTRRDDVIAFCQARATEGGAGALIVLLKPSSPMGG